MDADDHTKTGQGRAGAVRATAAALLIAVAGLAAVGAHLLTPTPSQAQEDVTRFLRLAAGPADAPAYRVAELLAAAVSAPLGGRPCDKGGSCGVPGLIAVAQSVETPETGLALLRAGQADVAIAPAVAVDPRATELYSVATLYSVDLHVLVPAASAARSLADLLGKKVAVAVDALGGPDLPRAVIHHAKLVPGGGHVFLTPRDMGLEALRDGGLDALFVMTPAPAPALVAAAEKIPLRLIPVYASDLPEVWRDRMRPVRLTADLYKMEQGADTVGAPVQLLTSARLDPAFVQGLTLVLWSPQTAKLLQSGPPETRAMRLEGGLAALVAPLHPGAVDAYRQLGVIKP